MSHASAAVPSHATVEVPPATTPTVVKPAVLVRADAPGVTFVQRFTPATSNLDLLSAGEYHIPPGAQSGTFGLPTEEAILYMWKGRAVVRVEGRDYALESYDTLYIPRGAAFHMRNASESEPAKLIQTSAPATRVHPVFHARFAEFSRREDRIRRLKGKNVYLMHDVSEGADKLVVGYTLFEPHARSWPPHNHTDQEEVYIFVHGEGSMEVYESPETMTFVKSVKEGDMVTIPILNYHPVFSQEKPVHFIWCIAGERYWVGDKNKDFMAGSGGPITT